MGGIRSAFNVMSGIGKKDWQMPLMRGNVDNGITLTAVNIPIPYLAFDYNNDTCTSWRESSGGWINIQLPYEISLEHGVFHNWYRDKHGALICTYVQIFTDASMTVPVTTRFYVGDNNMVVPFGVINPKLKTSNLYIKIEGWWPCVREIYLYGKQY